jgi:pimeloyl-ACP methyl ester carboxylesterase
MHMKLYAYLHPNEIAGLVFVDPSHEDQAEGYRKLDARHLSHEQWNQLLEPGLKKRRECAAAAPAGFVEGTELYKKCGFPQDPHYSAAINKVHTNIDMQPGFQRAQLSEEENLFSVNTEQLHAARRELGDVPLIVLTEAPSAPIKSETQAVRDAKNELWLNLNKDIASLSSHGVDRVVPGAGHAIQFDQPQAVIDAVLEVLAAARKR